MLILVYQITENTNLLLYFNLCYYLTAHLISSTVMMLCFVFGGGINKKEKCTLKIELGIFAFQLRTLLSKSPK